MRNGTVVSPTVRFLVSTALNRETTQLKYRKGVVATKTNSRRAAWSVAPRNVTGEPVAGSPEQTAPKAAGTVKRMVACA